MSTKRTLAANPAIAALRTHLVSGAWTSRAAAETAAINTLVTEHGDWAADHGRARAQQRRAQSVGASSPLPDTDVLAARGAQWQVKKMLAREIQRGNVEQDHLGRIRLIYPRCLEWATLTGAPQPKPPAAALDNTSDVEDTSPAPKRGRLIPPLLVLGIPEADLWDMAPGRTGDQVNFRTDQEINVADLAGYLPEGCSISRGVDDLYRVWTPDGNGDTVRAVIAAWAARNNVWTHDLRVKGRTVFRRDLRDIPEPYRSELVDQATTWLLHRSGLTLRSRLAHLYGDDTEEITQRVRIWVADAVSKYDNTKQSAAGTPLTLCAFLLGKARHLQSDLSRAEKGRGEVDREVAIRAAVDALVAETGRQPSDADLADHLGWSISTLKETQQAISLLQNVNNWVPLHGGSVHHHDDADDGWDVAADVTTDDDPDIAALQTITSTLLLDCAVMESGGRGRRAHDTVGLAAKVLTAYAGIPRSEVAAVLAVTPKAVADSINRMEQRARDAADVYGLTR